MYVCLFANSGKDTEAHLGLGELLHAASLQEVAGESKARSQRFLVSTVFICLLKIHKSLSALSVN